MISTSADGLLGGGMRSARKRKRAQILLAADRGASDCDNIGVGGSTVYRTKRRPMRRPQPRRYRHAER
jgi:hypothetical protein